MIKILGVDYFDCDDIKNILINKYKQQLFDATGNISIIAASFVANKPYIIREPNQDYIEREIQK